MLYWNWLIVNAKQMSNEEQLAWENCACFSMPNLISFNLGLEETAK